MICSLRFKKDALISKLLLWNLWFLKLYHIQVVVSLPLWIKLTIRQLLLYFLCNFWSFFSYVGRFLVTNLLHCYWLILKYNTRGTFVIIFLICSDLLHCLRGVGTMFITTESGYNSLKVIFTKQSLTKTTIFLLFWCALCTITQDLLS